MRRSLDQGVFIVHRFKDLKVAGTWTFLLHKSSLTYKFGAYWVVWSVFKFWDLFTRHPNCKSQSLLVCASGTSDSLSSSKQIFFHLDFLTAEKGYLRHFGKNRSFYFATAANCQQVFLFHQGWIHSGTVMTLLLNETPPARNQWHQAPKLSFSQEIMFRYQLSSWADLVPAKRWC